MILTALIAVYHLTQSPMAKEISLEAEFLKTEDVVARISQKSGIEMTAVGDLRRYPLYLSVHNVPVSEIMPKIALVTGGEWQKRGTGWVLSADATLKFQQEKLADPQRENRIKRALETELNFLADRPELTERSALLNREATRAAQADNQPGPANPGPHQQAILKLLAKIGPTTLAQIKAGTRIVFSNRPNAVQSRLPGNNSEILVRFIRESAILANLPPLRRDGEILPFAVNGRFLRNRNGNYIFSGLGPKPAAGNPANPGPSLLVLSRDGISDSISVTLTCYDDQQREIASGSHDITPAEIETNLTLQGKSALSLTELAKDYAAVIAKQQNAFRFGRLSVLSFSTEGMSLPAESTQEWAGAETVAFSLDRLSAPYTPLSKELIVFLRSIEKADPWSVLGPTLLHPIAAKQNIIALIPDALFQRVATLVNDPKMTCEEALHQLSKTPTLEVSQSGIWITIRPSAPQTYRESYVNRSALGTMLRTTLTDGFADLNTVTKFAFQQDQMVGGATFGLLHLKICQRTTEPGAAAYLEAEDYDSTRWIGSLTSVQRTTALKGGNVGLNDLSADQVQLFSRITFNSADGPTQTETPNNSATPSALKRPWVSERTLLLPNGLPGSTWLSFAPAEIKNEWLGRSSESGQLAFGGPKLATSKTEVIGTKKAPGNRQNPISSKLLYDRFMRAQSSSYSYRLQLTPSAELKRIFEDHQADTSRAFAYDEMPSDFRQAAEAQAKTDKQLPKTPKKSS